MIKRLFILLLAFFVNINSQNFENFLNPERNLSSSLPTPKDILDLNVGKKPLRYEQVFRYYEVLADKSSRLKLVKEGKTHEGRKLFYAVVSSENNLGKLNEIKAKNALLADPRKAGSEEEVDKLISSTPAIALMMYSIHGDELSGTDASVQLAYELAAGESEEIKSMLDEMVVIIYPMENPDGRERFLSDVQSWSGEVPNSDQQSMPHSGIWPGGRTNHYFFDLNRDWFILSQPETKARFQLLREWNPHLVVDAHEMGSNSTFLFNPPREPVNPNIHKRIIKWWKTFAEDQAEAFDNQGWNYYTREWLEEWYPGYGSSLPSYMGAVSILYEQAGTEGSLVKRADGTVLTFAGAVHRQLVSSLANLKSALDNKEELMKGFYEVKKDAVNKTEDDYKKTYLIKNDENQSRINKLLDKLLFMGFEIYEADEPFETEAKDYWTKQNSSERFEKGTYIIPAGQPLQPLINAVMEFDTRMKTSFLQSERESIEKGKGTRLYEVSAWSLPIAYNVDAYVTSENLGVEKSLVENLTVVSGKMLNPSPRYGYVIELNDDNVYKALYNLLKEGYKVRAAEKPFKIEDKEYPKGTLLLRKIENPENLDEYLQKAADEHNIKITGVNTALAQTGTDLGGGNFELLYEPKTAILTGPSTSTNSFGYMWYLFDHELEMRISKLNVNYFNYYDLRKYNVLIMPSTWGGSYKTTLGEKGLRKLKEWTENGGTLIAVDGAAQFMADTSNGFSKVGLRRQNLKRLPAYEKELEWERSLQAIIVDSIKVWSDGIEPDNEDNDNSKDTAKLKKKDNYLRKFMPRGAILKLDLNQDHWLSYGAGAKIPAIFSGRSVYLSKRPVKTAARFADAGELRVSGLIWKEAKERIKNTAYLTRESLGKGQIIMFADDPNFRSYFYGTQRLFLNSVFFGPGFGTKQPIEW